jgi:hypothetical protein
MPTDTRPDAGRPGHPPHAAVAYTCPNCSAPLEGRTCKLRCTRCGYFESCSDLEPAPTRASGG